MYVYVRIAGQCAEIVLVYASEARNMCRIHELTSLFSSLPIYFFPKMGFDGW